MEYYIYHIKGVKIGCSKNPKKRVKGQGYTDFEILESYDSKSVAAQREIELQKEYGYKVDLVKYDEVDYESNGYRIATTINKHQGRKNAESGHMSELGKKYANIGGSVMTPKKQKHLENVSKLGNQANIKKYGHSIKAINLKTKEESCFESIGLASRQLSINKRLILNCLQNKQTQTKGYMFFYNSIPPKYC